MKDIQVILNAILDKNIFEYITVDKELNITSVSSGVQKYFENIPKEADDILDYMPELVGSEDEVKEIFLTRHSSYSLETVNKNNYYINISIEYCNENAAIILLYDITAIIRSNRKILQYANESTLLSNALKKITNEQKILIAQQSKLAIMGEMINNIAHQWRQPLNRINSNIAVMNSICSDDQIEDKMIKPYMKNITKNTEYMSNTIEDFTKFFHPDKKKVKFSIQDTVNEVLELIQSRLSGIEVVISSEKMLSAISYRHEYYQILMSILNNSIDNFDSKKLINPKIEIIIKSDKKMVSLSIQDNGGGIEEKNINRIFEPYYTTKSTNEGNGLGLYISKMIIEKSMKGNLSVRNTSSGACFEIKIPIDIIKDN